ncbi:uncharacterized protein JCM6883_007527 [Sporobolomyces salmoneus]|uniref:uncharacterized protein n=1 Tax=Sporobolomyces salmoneus TaxID=183962 RepID=UPI00316B1E89
MSPQLPVELLRLVVENLRLPPYTSSLRTRKLEDETRSTLYTLSLTTTVLSEIAQPLLYAFVRIPAGETALSRLVRDGNTNGLSLVRTMALGEEDWKEQWSTDDFSHLNEHAFAIFGRLEQLITYSSLWRTLNLLHGSNLKRVFLNDADIDTTAISHHMFASLEVLGLRTIGLVPDPLPIASFPSLRHLCLDSEERGINRNEAATLTALKPQLDSITLEWDTFGAALRQGLTLQLASILADLPYHWVETREWEEPYVVNPRLLIDEHDDPEWDSPESPLDSFASKLQDRKQFARLKSIYLPTRSSLREVFHTDAVGNSIENLALAAKNRGVLVVFTEQSGRCDAECQISEDFMRRMTQKRIARKAEERKQISHPTCPNSTGSGVRSFLYTTYKDRQSTLCSLSLVSRQFRAIAQPLLFEIVRIKSEAQLELLLGAGVALARPRELVIGQLVSSKRVTEAFGSWNGLESLEIQRRLEDPLYLAVLVQRTKVVNLRLWGDGFAGTNAGPFTFLRSLTFDYLAMNAAVLRLLDPEVLPSLRALGLRHVFGTNNLCRLERTSLAHLLPQLDAIVISADLYHLAVNGLFSDSSRILIDIYDYRQTFSVPARIQGLASVHHLRMVEGAAVMTSEHPRRVLKLLAARRASKTWPLKSIYVGPWWHPSRIGSSDIAIEMDQVMEECQRDGLELIFESQELTRYLSQEFYSRQRKKREEE